MILIDPQTSAILGVLFCSTLVRSTFGFGDALLAMPILAVIAGLKTATPLVALVATTIALVILIGNRSAVEMPGVWRLILSTLAGIPIGLFLLRGSHETAMKLALAAIIIAFSLYSLIKPVLPMIRSERSSFVFGFLAGILGGAYNTNGPPIVIYGSLRRWTPVAFRASLQAYFFLTGWMIVAAHCAAGLWTNSVLRLYFLALPVVLCSVFVGGRLHRAIPTGKFNKFIYVLLLGIGLFLGLNTSLSIWGDR